MGHIERRYVSVCQRNRWMLMDSSPWGWESKTVEMSKRMWLSRSDLQAKKMVAFHLLGSVTSPIWLSRPFVGVEQYWWSLQRCDAGSRTLRPQNLVIACVYPNSHCHPDVDVDLCSCLPMSSSADGLQRGATHCARTFWWYLVPIPNSPCVDPCSFFSSCRCWFLCSSLLLNTCLHWWPPDLGGAMFDMVVVPGIPSFLDCYLNIKPLLHRPAGLSLGIASASTLSYLLAPSLWEC